MGKYMRNVHFVLAIWNAIGNCFGVEVTDSSQHDNLHHSGNVSQAYEW